MTRMDSLADPEKRYTLKGLIGSGVCGNVYEAIDEDAGRSNIERLYCLANLYH